ncbi:MAG: hypothetical protein H0T69_11490 [Thermoleophilaceae bacterium]|nr:hypothetical protein [Thermoleophilaceae bacterium]
MKASTRKELLPAAVLGALALIASAVILRAGRDTIFFFDEWDFLLGRRGTSVDTFLEPHVGHLSLVPILIYKTLFSTVGLEPYWPYRVVVLLFHLVCVGLFYAVARRRVGAWPAVGLAALLLFVGSAWEVLLWPFEISYLASLAAGLGAWLVLSEEGRGRDISASVLIGLAVASSGVGVPVALGVLAGLLLDPERRSRAWLVAPPLALYAIWLIGWGLPAESPERIDLANLPDTPRYMAEMAASAAGGLSGLGEDWGRIFVAVFATVVLFRVLRSGVSAWLGAGLVTAFAFWGLTGLARADVSPASTSRYIYPSAVFLLLIVLALPGRAGTWRTWATRRRLLWVIVAGAVVLAAIGNLAPLRDGGRHLRTATDAVVPTLAALEVGGSAIPPDTRPEPQYAPQVAAGQYLAAVRDRGSALPDGLAGELRGPDAPAVEAALIRAEGINLARATGVAIAADPPRVLQAIMGRTRTSEGCVRFSPGGASAALDVEARAGQRLTVLNRGQVPAEVRLRRFAPDFPAAALGAVPPRARQALSLPDDPNPAAWAVRISPGGPVLVCMA